MVVVDFAEVDWRSERRRGHDGKVWFPGPVEARAAAEVASVRCGDRICPYRCPWVPGSRHWHIGHALSGEGLERLAVALRAFTEFLATGGRA